MKKLFNLLLLVIMSIPAMASHISGGEIVWNCLGNNLYEVSVILYRDCDGISAPTTVFVDITSSCGSESLSISQDSLIEVSQLCDLQIGQSSCNGGNLPGMQAAYFTDTVTLPPCSDWVFGYDICCRNAAIVNLANPGGADFYVEASMDNTIATCDNSAQFTAQPIPYVCVNQLVNYSFGTFDPDGDSLNYSIISAMESGGGPLPYSAGYSAAQPIPGLSINQFTGLVSFTPTTQGSFVIVVQVEQFDNQGNLIATVMRDIQFVVIACSNIQPYADDGDMSNFTGSALQTDSMSVQMCATDNFCFDFTIGDPNAIDTITLTTNVTQVLPGATFNYSGINPVTGQICWTGQVGSEGLNSFTITANDNACQIPGFQTYVYDVFVLQRTSAGPDQTLCGPQTAPIQALGGSIFTWSVLSGDPLSVGPLNAGNNFTCNPCDNPVAMPAVTTTYVVQSNLTGGCVNSDTITINVVPDFTYTIEPADTTVCLQENVDFQIQTNMGTAGFNINWTPATGISNPNVANPTGFWLAPGTYNYDVDIISPDGCSQQDTTVTVTVLPAYKPAFTVEVDNDSVCYEGSTTAYVVFDNEVPGSCGLNYDPCPGGGILNLDLGNGTQSNTGTGYPAPYGNFFNGARHQIMYRASELQALGFTAGTITDVAFEVTNLNTSTTDYQNFEIKMGCTTLNEFNSNWVNGLEIVFPAQTVTIATGWVSHDLTYGFNWDGVSNLVIEICFDMNGLTTGFTNNASTTFTPTAFNSVLFFRSDAGGVCYGGTPTSSSDRPNVRLGGCVGVDPSSVGYTWTPSSVVNPGNTPSVTVSPDPNAVPQTITAVVGNPVAGCADTASVVVDMLPPVLVDFDPSPGVAVAPGTVGFVNLSGNGIGNWNWNFGDGNFSNDFNPANTYNSTGWYYITLTGTDVLGCEGFALDSVEIIDRPIAIIPNVFSPNGDDVNDHFEFLELRGFVDIEVIVYNRWGNKVKELTAVPGNNRIWSPGSSAEEGTYFYTFKGKAINGEEIELAGHVTLLRVNQE